ncbi:9-O-acetylesterase [Flavobacterium rhamnosiphilum]|uniref:9-O-acetylesterase n=1 Tax=Flavobacterium rhamnosiphilum TaxID=2541724 RepID=A0A4R5F8T8_9FLAO|nr:sialate O-acetylesterase [Flavobacterium rhamnosiphilum]TDE44876.1 9-O-acetylesterase [Flavobacterium rhamnosiphilum]
MKRIISFLLIIISGPIIAMVTLPKFFSNHMVLQRDASITIYGWADAGKTVKINFNNKNLETKVNTNGEWSIDLPGQKAGGPFIMTIKEDNEITFQDIYIGDVWFCSGQSNMGWKLEDALNGKEELSKANYKKIKLLQVSRTMAGTPQKDIEKGQWEPCYPENAKGFSAIAYFFGRELYHEYKVPIGLINSSWGGTNIEAWMSEDIMGKHESAKKVIAEMKNINFPEVIANYNKDFKIWEDKADKLDIGMQERWYDSSYDTSSWKTINLPIYWSMAKIIPNDGIIWVSRTFELSQKELSQKEFILSIGRIDNEDVTYINGKIVGESKLKDLDRFYKIPKNIFTIGKNTITIRVKNSGDIGGFRSAKEALYLQTALQKISLAGEWKYETGTKNIEEVPVRQHPTKYATSLYNGMVAPFFGIKIKGIIWYQAESNSNNATEYAGLFKEMIADWRKKWKSDYPFIFAQLPNYANQNNRWITLRESQAKALELKNTGMAVLIDVGDDDNIHPVRKQIVGKRMATIAGNLAFGKKELTISAPVFENHKTEGNSIIVTFKNGTFAPETPKSGINGFMIAGNDKKFYPANSYLQNDMKTIKLRSEKVSNPKEVRYLWDDAPGKIMLYNKDGLVTPPFRTDTL